MINNLKEERKKFQIYIGERFSLFYFVVDIYILSITHD